MSRPISVSRFERKLRAILGVAGSAIVSDLEGARGLLLLETDRPEWERAGGVELLWNELTQGIVAAQRSIVGVRNPAASGMLGILETWSVNASASIWALTTDSTGIAPLATVPMRSRDLRAPIANQGSALEMFSYSVAAAGREGIELFQNILNAGDEPKQFPIILPPDSRVLFSTVADATLLTLSLAARAVPLEGGILG